MTTFPPPQQAQQPPPPPPPPPPRVVKWLHLVLSGVVGFVLAVVLLAGLGVASYMKEMETAREDGVATATYKLNSLGINVSEDYVSELSKALCKSREGDLPEGVRVQLLVETGEYSRSDSESIDRIIGRDVCPHS